jgi:hypothetical protein
MRVVSFLACYENAVGLWSLNRQADRVFTLF